MRKPAFLMSMIAAVWLSGAAARAEEPGAASVPFAATDPDVAGDEAPAPPEDQARRPGSRWLTDEEEARLRIAGEQAKLAARSASDRLKVQGEALKAVADQLKPTPEEMARLRALVDEQKTLLREQTADVLERQIEALQKQLRELRRGREE